MKSVIALKVKDWILCILSAILLALSFPHINFWILAWVAFLPLFFALQNKSNVKAFLFSYLTGIIFWLGIIYWLMHVTLPGTIILVLYLALYFGVFGIIFRHSLLTSRHSLIFIPTAWVLLEYLRSHLFTGFGWVLLGYSQYLNLPLIQIANITGVWGVSFLVMMVNVLIYEVLRIAYSVLLEKQKKSFIVSHYLLVLFLLFLSLGYGFYKLRTGQDTGRTALKISVIQGNIPQAIKWEKVAKEKILKEYFRLSRLAASDCPDLIIWPEAALPGILQEDPNLKKNLKAFVYNIQIPLLAGIVSLNRDNYYNSAVMLSREGEFIQRYDKLHLVPFGEYIPFKRIFGFLETVVPIGDFMAGKEYTVFLHEVGGRKQKAIHFSVLICFEDIFPELSRQFVREGADFLVNITNDAWFLDTSSPYQHLSASVFRAIENGVYLVRAANTGISGFITPQGRVWPLTENGSGKQTFVSGYKTKSISPTLKKSSLYTQYGDWLVLACLLCVLFGVIKSRRIH